MRKLFVLFLSIILTFTSCSYPSVFQNVQKKDDTSLSSNKSDFQSLLEEEYLYRISQDALSLRFSLRNPDKYLNCSDVSLFEDLSSDGINKDLSHNKDFYSSLNQLDKDSLSSRDQFVYDVVKDYYYRNLKLQEYPYYQEIISSQSGKLMDYSLLLSQYPFYSKKDIVQYFSIIENTDIFFSCIFDYETEKFRRGLGMNSILLEEIISYCNDSNTEQLLITSFQDRIRPLSFLTHEEKQLFLKQNKKIIYDIYLPSLQSLGNKLTLFRGQTKNEKGLCHFPKGKQYYQLLLCCATNTDKSPFLLYHQIQEERAFQIHQMKQLLSSNPDLLAMYDNYHFPNLTPSEMLEVLQNEMITDFPTSVNVDYSIHSVNSVLEDFCAPAFYLIAPLDYYIENHIFYNSKKVTSSLDLFTTLAHESYPGHLYQTVMSYHYGLEPIRSTLSFPGYTEGWATFVEDKSYFYTKMNPNVASLYVLHHDILLSLYSSADIGIHYYGWDIKQCHDFFSKYNINNPDITHDIYLSILRQPTNYLKYYVGAMEFNQLENDFSLKYENFSKEDFYQQILKIGPSPFYLLKKELEDYFKSSNSW